ncbi:polysaccharide exporter lipoprotein precursor [Flavobacterium limnosediminis JC2902]|uniref:Polysaccharide exporter lipoprotein n=1 Tax=Flavobacterium limnosediminis JC2902 TaxID=1341181 RepID=V6SLZ8_9FLAO|nr:polysaccharide biosynthesis/export family protein [Flavobacterium limnosediminis]ESU27257.1 polysaccharide exporter lipoprotein precursor [Flavobacterium limnosediminis JC2902]
MKSAKKYIFFSVIIGLLITSCASKQNILYLQDTPSSSEITSSYDTKIKSDDILLIIVSSENAEVAAPYNLKLVSIQNHKQGNIINEQMQSYIVDKKGEIDFPLIGNIKLGGLTKTEAVATIKDKLKEHVSDAVVNLRILNYKITVLGEVNKPGAVSIPSERITILEALGMAGDLTIYGNRKNVLLIREVNGVKTMNRIDLTKTDFVSSPYYYLDQNDVIYVEPNKTKVNSSVIGPNVSVGISVVSLIITVIVLVTQ